MAKIDPVKFEEIYNQEIISPCNSGCPAGINIPGYIALILEKDLENSYKLIRNNNPFPAITGRVCPHPCETKCIRGDVDEPESICLLKVIPSNYVKNLPKPLEEKILPKKGKSVGIIGGGPTGLSCAYYLARLGYDVTVYEKEPVAGGMMAHGIPEYRAPMEIVQWEVEVIKRLGVEIKVNTEVGKDISFDEVEQKHDAIYIGIGMSNGTYIRVPNEHAEGVYQAVDFLKQVKHALYFKEPLPKLGDRVVVIGGGNVAIDAARTARRLGIKEVIELCLEKRHEMPAWEHEIVEAIEEGVDLRPGWGPKEITVDKNGKVKSITFKECVQVFDENHRFSPKYDENNTITFDVDSVIMAVGQSPDSEFLKNVKDMEFFRGKWIIADKTTLQTNHPGVFAGGDIVKPGLLIDAIAAGRRAAAAIDMYLEGTGKILVDEIKIPLPHLEWKHRPEKRIPVKKLEGKERLTFKEFVQGFITEEAGYHEADRCLACDPPHIDIEKCIGCGTCIKNCPYEAISFEFEEIEIPLGTRKIRHAKIDRVKCHSCSICLSVCPVNAITMTKWSNERFFTEIEDFIIKGRN
ncbi:MAG: FAD-dependent oxidoreductase [Promethearchaeota archaeon]